MRGNIVEVEKNIIGKGTAYDKKIRLCHFPKIYQGDLREGAGIDGSLPGTDSV